ncbi:MAG TPA: polysaccharide deacetylase family protein [Verrucomicrobiae bacterium]|nr:polysaccharide deacetylase family protein [Verrucomicrobiae bacterium]
MLVAAVLLLVADAFGAEVTFAHRLGWKSNDVVIILHVDDVGMSHSSNLGAIEATEKGVATSWSVMMPCPWVPEIAHYLKAHPEVDCGLHLTLNSEWASYRWGPLAGKAQVPGLVDDEGCLWRNVAQVTRKATPDEIETEIRAQIDRAETLGIPITHLDSHMGTLLARSDYFERFVKVGVEKQIPVLCVGSHMTHALQGHRETAARLQPWVKKIWNAGLPVIDDIHTDSYGWKPEEKTDKLLALLHELQPGITEILFHASLPTEDFPLITDSSGSRHADLKALTDPRVRELIQERGVIRTTWRELKERRKKAALME